MPVKGASPLAVEIAAMGDAVGQTDKLVQQLFERLEPVIMKQAATPSNAAQPPDGPISEAPGRVRNHRRSLEAINMQIDSLIAFLQV